tara:strand:- start:2997 stop:3266 length:270 start_codon:yes stop_codon:yes gene_type:complete
MKKDIQRGLVRRLKIIEGQVRGIQKMVDEDKYCMDIITQTSAIRHSLGAVEEKILENHLSTHVIEHIKAGKHAHATKEILSAYKLARKK